MRLAVVGVGAVGGYFGGLLARSRADVHFVARGATLAALRDRGLVIDDGASTTVIGPLSVTDDPAALGRVDAVLVATKASELPGALEAIVPLVDRRTRILTMQNGVEAPEIAARRFGEAAVVPTVVRIFTQLTAPAVISHRGGTGTLTLNSWHNRAEEVTGLHAALTNAGIQAIVAPDIWVDLWTKAMFVEPFGALGAVTGEPIGVLRSSPRLRSLLRQAAEEVRQVALGRGIGLDAASVGRTLELIDAQPHGSTSSLQRDLLAGRPSELDAQVGAVCRIGESLGVPTPLHDLMFEILSRRPGRR